MFVLPWNLILLVKQVQIATFELYRVYYEVSWCTLIGLLRLQKDGIFVNGRMRRRFEWWYIYEWVDEEKVWRMVYLWMGGWGEGLKDGIFMNGWMRRRFEWWYICKWVDEEKDGMMVYLWMGGWEKGFEWWHICELVDEKKVLGRQMMISSLV